MKWLNGAAAWRDASLVDTGVLTVLSPGNAARRRAAVSPGSGSMDIGTDE
jgi:hypothetical protein